MACAAARIFCLRGLADTGKGRTFGRMKLIRLLPLLVLALLCSCHPKKVALGYTDDVYYTETNQQRKPHHGHSSDKPQRPASLPSGDAGKVLREARRWMGVPYRYGGHTHEGTDCSGMVMEVYQRATGVALPRTVAEQSQWCRRCDLKATRPGDLVFFCGSRRGQVAHVGIYAGDGEFIHASTSRGVIVSRMDDPYWQSHYEHSGRVLR